MRMCPDFSGSPRASLDHSAVADLGFTAGLGLASKIDAIPFAPHRAVLQ
jgi:hypothetical protein